jgi:hypothetical protein
LKAATFRNLAARRWQIHGVGECVFG